MAARILGFRWSGARSITTVCLIGLCLICLAPDLALASTGHEYKRSFGTDCTAGSHFETPGAIAVDEASGDIYVANLGGGGVVASEVFRCTASGAEAPFTAGAGAGTNHIGGFFFPRSQGQSQIAVQPTSHDFYVADFGDFSVKAFHDTGAPATFSAGPGAGTNELFSFGPCGVTTDANGDLYVAEVFGGVGFAGAIKIFSPTGEEITSFETKSPCNLAVDSQGGLYVVHESTRAIEKFLPSSFPVTPTTTYTGAAADPGPALSLAVDPTTNDLYVAYVDELQAGSHKRSRIRQKNDLGEELGTFPEPGEAETLEETEGIAVNGATGDVYASDARLDNGASIGAGKNQVDVFPPAAPLPPGVNSSTATGVTATSARLEAKINPHHFGTKFKFELLTEAAFHANGNTFAGARQTPIDKIGQAGIERTASAVVTGLQPETAYVFRVAAENVNNAGSPVFSIVASGEGEFRTFAPSAAVLSDNRAYELVSPAAKPGQVFAPEPSLLGSCIVKGIPSLECYPGALAKMSPLAVSSNGERVSYMGDPFFANTSVAANSYLGTRSSGGWTTQSLTPSNFVNGNGHQGYVGFSPDLTKAVVSQISPALSPEAPASSGGLGYANLYLRSSDGGLEPLITQVPPHRSAGRWCQVDCNELYVFFAGGNSGSPSVPAYTHLIFEANDALTPEVDGVAPAAPEVGEMEFNLYEWSGGKLHLVNVLPGNGSAVTGAMLGSGRSLVERETETANFDNAISEDGARVFWSRGVDGQVFVRIDGDETKEIHDGGRFMTASTGGSKVLLKDGCLYGIAAEACEADLTQGHGASTFDGILGASDDLSRIYFVDREALTAAQENSNHEIATAGEHNLYVWNEGVTTFIGTLSPADKEVGLGAYGVWKSASADRLAQVSPDGNYLSFVSISPLTGYNNVSGDAGGCSLACFEVFEYDASSNSLVCASCNPAGVKPQGASLLPVIPGGEESVLGEVRPTPFPQAKALSVDGRVFFNSRDSLVPGDTNGGVKDVYEWEPAGVGSCAEPGGCIALLSSGRDSSDSHFLGASPSGEDAMFVTRAQLVPSDKNQQLDLYDARVDGGFAEASVGGCVGEGCKGPIATPPTATGPASAIQAGSGNVKPKKKHHRKRHHKKGKRAGSRAKHDLGGSK